MKAACKKAMAFFLTLAMCFSLLPAGVLAADGGAIVISPTVDRTIKSDDEPDTGKENQLRLKWATGAAYYRVVLLQFPLDDVSAVDGAEVLLRLYASTVESSFTADNGMWLYSTTTVPADQSFAGAAALCTEENKVVQIKEHTAGTWLEVDVSAAVKAAKNANATQLTFIFKSTQLTTAGNNGVEFYSTRHSDASLRPNLQISVAPVITKISAVEAETVVGSAPTLPDRVEAHYDNGDKRSVEVTWNTDSADFDAVGKVVVSGAVAGTDIQAKATIWVKNNNVPSGRTFAAKADIYVQAGTHADKTPAQSSSAPAYITTKLRTKNSNNSATQEYTRRIYLLYDLTELTQEPYKAQIVLHLTNDSNNPEKGFGGGDIYALTGNHTASEFGENSITWNSADTWEKTKCGSFSGSVTGGAVYADVTGAVKAAMADGKTSLGFMLEVPTAGSENGINFWSSRGATDVNTGKGPAMYIQGAPIIAGVADVETRTEVGQPPVLPATVTASLSAGGTAEEPVTWEAVAENSYAAIGSFTVKGSLDNYFDVPVQATVTVTPPEGYTGTTYYLDATLGDNNNTGTTPEQAWKNLDKVNSHPAFLPGDQILLKRGETWNGYLRPRGNGLVDSPITLASYGEGNRPIINGGGTTYAKYSATVMLYNLSHWVVDGLEITNYGVGEEAGKTFSGYARAGIYVFACDQNRISEGFEIKNCYVHDVVSNTSDSLSGTSPKMTGGIIVLAEFRDIDGTNVRELAGIDADKNHRAGFRDIDIHNNIVLRTMHEGIRTKVEGSWGPADGYPRNAADIRIRDNYIEKTLGDGIVVGESNGGITVERNVVKDAAYWQINSVYYASVWCHYAKDTLFQYNEIFGTRYGQGDGEAFDADNYSDGTIFQYNYTHDNWGGSCLFMNSQTNSIFRYNISANDGTRSGEEIINAHSVNTTSLNASVPNVYNNTFYIDKNSGTFLFGSTTGNAFANFRNNIIQTKDNTKTLKFVKGTAPNSSIIQNNIFSHDGLFSSKLPSGFDRSKLASEGNIFADAMLKNPGATGNHDTTDFIALGGLNGVEDMLQNPVTFMRARAAEFTPQAGSPAYQAGINIRECELTEDILGNPIGSHPSIGAIEPVDEIGERIRVACVGDSITYGSTFAVPGLKNGYPTQLQGLLGTGYLVGNFGFSGATMQMGKADSYTTKLPYEPSKAFAPDIVIIMLGTNDSKAIFWDAAQYKTDALAMVEIYKKLPSKPTVFVATSPTALGANNYDIQSDVVNSDVVRIQKEVAAEAGCAVIDVHEGTKNFTAAELPDNIHGNDAGYAVIAQIIKDGIITPIHASAPTISTNLPSAQSVDENRPLTLSVTATVSDNGTLTYQWYKDGAAISNATSSSYTVESAGATHAGVYKVVVTNTLNGTTATATSIECTVTITPLPATPIGGSVSIMGDAKFDVTLRAVTSEITPVGATVSYAWSRDDSTALGTESTYTVVQGDIGHTITLTVMGSGEYTGSKTATTAMVTRADGPAAPESGLFTVTGETAFGAGDGTIDGITAAMEWSVEGSGPWHAGDGNKLENLVCGNYQVRYAKTDTHLAGALQTLTVLAYDMTQEPTPEASFDAANMTLSDVDEGMRYSLDGGITWNTIEGSSIILDEADVVVAKGIQVKKLGNGTTTMDSEVQAILLTQAAAPAVSGLGQTADDSGAITGTSTAIEYRALGEETWKPCSTDSTEVRPGDYEVRVAGKDTVLASQSVPVNVAAYVPPTGRPVIGVKLNQTSATLHTNTTPQTLALTATIEPEDADNKNLVWSSQNKSVAKVDEKGIVTAVGNGTTTVTVTTVDGGFAATCTITVMTYETPYVPPNPPKPIITENEDGSTTTKVTDKKTGTVTETTEYPNGKVVVSITKKDGSTEKNITEADGKKIQTAVTPKGDKTIAVTTPNGMKAAEVAIPKEVSKPAEEFADIPESYWARGAIDFVAGMGLMNGAGDGRFVGEAPVTRGMLATMLHRLSGEIPSQAATFEDVAQGQWYTEAVLWAADNGVVRGVSVDNFQPMGELTRESLAVMLYRYAALLGLDTDIGDEKWSDYADAGQVSSWARDAMSWAIDQGLLIGGESGSLAPAATASRAEVSVILMRFIERLR